MDYKSIFSPFSIFPSFHDKSENVQRKFYDSPWKQLHENWSKLRENPTKNSTKYESREMKQTKIQWRLWKSVEVEEMKRNYTLFFVCSFLFLSRTRQCGTKFFMTINGNITIKLNTQRNEWKKKKLFFSRRTYKSINIC